jgi:hypothetical protein
MEPKRCMLGFEIDIDLRQEIKVLAARRNITVKEWIHRAITDRIQKESKYNKEHVQLED